MKLADAARKAQALKNDYVKVVALSMRTNAPLVLDLQKTQLLSGVDKHGNLLTPSYSDDSYFVSPDGAKNYEKKKAELEEYYESLKFDSTLFPKKPSGTPNLIKASTVEKARFQPGLTLSVGADEYTIESTWVKAPRVEFKFPSALGINPTSFTYFWNRKAKGALATYFYYS